MTTINPGDPYVSLAALKAYLKVTSVDANRDTNLTSAALAASRRIDALTGRTFTTAATATARTIRTDRATFLTPESQFALIVPDIASTTGLVTGRDDATYVFDGVSPITTFYSGAAWTGPTVSVTARWGWPACPEEIIQATKILAARLFRRADSPDGIAGSDQWGAVRVTRTDPDVQALIDPYMLPGMA